MGLAHSPRALRKRQGARGPGLAARRLSHRAMRIPGKGKNMMSANLQQVVAEHGPWTAMAIKLADGSYTRAPAVDHRLGRLVQMALDLSGKPLSAARVVDLGCLEGHYAIE